MSCIKGNLWTDEEKQIVIDNFSTKTKEELMELLPHRTWKAICHIIKKLKLRKKNNYESIAEWKLFRYVDDIRCMLCKNCRRYLPCDELHFPRDTNCKMGIRGVCKECKGEMFGTKDYWTVDEDNVLYSYYENETNRNIQKEFLPHKTIEQINHRASHLNIYKSEEARQKARINSQTDDWRNKISETKKINGSAKGENNPMYGSHRSGSLNPNWQGGVSELYAHLRRNLTQWKLDSAESCSYKCIFTGERFDDIHHLYSFHNIAEETLNELELPLEDKIKEYSDLELNLITQKCIEIHYRYPLGVCLKYEIHRLFHELFGFQDNTPDQFEEFKQRYLDGEFESLVMQHA